MTIECRTAEERDAMLQMRIDAGTARTRNLAKYFPVVLVMQDGMTTIASKSRARDDAAIATAGLLEGKSARRMAPTSLSTDAVKARRNLWMAPSAIEHGSECAAREAPGTALTVFTYDRRGRGNSGDTKPYAVEREVEDIAALLTQAGGSAFVWACPQVPLSRLTRPIATVHPEAGAV